MESSRRGFLIGTLGAASTAVLGGATTGPAAAVGAGTAVGTGAGHHAITLTAATNGSATLSPAGDLLIAEIQNVLWSVPRAGGEATALTAPELEPTRPVFSPDGRRIALCAYRGGTFHLWLMNPDGTGLRQLTHGEWDDRGPAWSPDGTRIAFSSERGGDTADGSGYRIWTVDVRTGDLTRVTGVPGRQGPLQEGAFEDFDPAWSPDGRQILCVRGHSATGGFAARTIVSTPVDGEGPTTTVLTEPGAASLLCPAPGPDGRLAHLRTTSVPDEPGASCALILDGHQLDTGGRVLPVPPRWTASGELLVNVDGQFRLIDPDGAAEAGEEIPFTARMPRKRPQYAMKRYDFDAYRTRPVRGIHLPALSPDGRTVAFAALDALWTVPVDGGAPRRIVRAEPTRYLHGPAWTPDGTALVYADDRDGLFAVRRHALADGAETVLAEGGRVHPALSPDGTRLACLGMDGTLFVHDLGSGRSRALAAPLAGGGLPGRPSWSPDGRHVALCDRNRLTQRFREGYNLVRVVDTHDGTDRLYPVAPHTSLSDRYDSGPVWSPDGRSMAVIVESALWLLPVRADGSPSGPATMLTSEPADHPSWSADGRTLAYLSAGRLRLRDLDGDRTRTVRIDLGHRRPRSLDTVVHAGLFWDGTGETTRTDVDVVVRQGRITAVEPHRARRPAQRRVDAGDRTVVPGLWDSHTHPWQYTYGGRQGALNLAYGITTAVSMGGFAYEQARLKEAVVAGRAAGPRLLTTGELLDGSRVAYSMGRAHRTRAGLRRSLARGEALDWDFVKTYVRAPGWMMKEAAAFGHDRLGVRTGSHLCVPGIQLGQDLTTHLHATQRLEHGHGLSASGLAYQDVYALYSDPGFHLLATPFQATMLVGADPGLADDPRVTSLMPPWDVEAVRRFAKTRPTEAELASLDAEMSVYRGVLAKGGVVALGTDAPLNPVGLHLHVALRALHRSGMTPAQALRTATALPARVFGADGDLGTLEVGKIADLTVVDGDPFEDFATLVRTEAVLSGGVLHRRRDLVAPFTGTAPLAHGAPGAKAQTPWRSVGALMRRDGCCDTRGD
ncbi:amidohydrolase family protein [Streptomyces sp. NPDC041068]|uniref:amidohydrolase family protein n=1 Tax=Streptomyces sp. NPDC041068 TaxID=3155130 RepID=UPI0033CCD4EB